jgi:hypothetical protein
MALCCSGGLTGLKTAYRSSEENIKELRVRIGEASLYLVGSSVTNVSEPEVQGLQLSETCKISKRAGRTRAVTWAEGEASESLGSESLGRCEQKNLWHDARTDELQQRVLG